MIWGGFFMETRINEAIKQVLAKFRDKYYVGKVLNKDKGHSRFRYI